MVDVSETYSVIAPIINMRAVPDAVFRLPLGAHDLKDNDNCHAIYRCIYRAIVRCPSKVSISVCRFLLPPKSQKKTHKHQ